MRKRRRRERFSQTYQNCHVQEAEAVVASFDEPLEATHTLTNPNKTRAKIQSGVRRLPSRKGRAARKAGNDEDGDAGDGDDAGAAAAAAAAAPAPAKAAAAAPAAAAKAPPSKAVAAVESDDDLFGEKVCVCV